MSVNRLASELRLVLTVDATTRLGGTRQAAVDWVGQAIGYPLVDRSAWHPLALSGSLAARQVLCLDRPRGVLALEGAGTWPEDAPPVGDPASLPAHPVLRFDTLLPGRFYVHPPAEGWPREGRLGLKFRTGLDPDRPGAQAIVQAVILAAREFYDGHRDIPRGHAIWDLLSLSRPATYGV